jgi:hypothetical protein
LNIFACGKKEEGAGEGRRERGVSVEGKGGFQEKKRYWCIYSYTGVSI